MHFKDFVNLSKTERLQKLRDVLTFPRHPQLKALLQATIPVGGTLNFFFKNRKTKKLHHVLTFPGHPQLEALLQTTILAAVPVDAIHDTVLLPGALIVDHGGLGPPEEIEKEG